MKMLIIPAGIIVVLLFVLFAFGPMIAERVYLRTPEMRAQYKDWKNKKLELPPEALEVKPFSEPTKAAARALQEAYLAHKYFVDNNVPKLGGGYDSNRVQPENLDSLDYVALERSLDSVADVIRAFKFLVTQPDYAISASLTPDPRADPSVPNFLMLQNLCELIRLEALSRVRSGNESGALESAESIVLASRVEPYSLLFSQMIAIAINSIGANTWYEVAMHCKNPALLRETLNKQNRLVGELSFLAEKEPIYTVDNIGTLREMKRGGMEINYQARTGNQLRALSAESSARLLESRLSTEPPDDAEKFRQIKAQCESMKTASAAMGGAATNARGYLAKLASPFVRPLLFKLTVPNAAEAKTRAEVAMSKFDLLRLETAKRLYELEHGAPPARATDLVPEYIAELPPDRFAPDRSAYHLASAFYSVGPDQKDDGGKVIYSPRNGTTSAGDIAFAQ